MCRDSRRNEMSCLIQTNTRNYNLGTNIEIQLHAVTALRMIEYCFYGPSVNTEPALCMRRESNFRPVPVQRLSTDSISIQRTHSRTCSRQT